MKPIRVFLLLFMLLVTLINADYWSERARFINTEYNKTIGYNITLNEKEEKVNGILMNYKLREIEEGVNNPESFLAAQHFFKAKTGIQQSKVFGFLKKLPKGSSLHSHDTGIVSEEFLYSLTFEDNLYGCISKGHFLLKFFKDSASPDKSCDWKLLADLRRKNPKFNNFIRSKLSLICDDPEKKYPDVNTVWNNFMEKFITVLGLVCYKPVFQKYFYQVLKELYEDNIMYLEFRGLLPEVYDLDGNTYGPVEVVGMYVETLNQFKKDYPDFHGARFIYGPSRNCGNNTIKEYIKTLRTIKKFYPEFIAGFDLVGQEDKGRPLFDFIPELLEIKDETKFFFHAGETDWNGQLTDQNLVDAVLLNTSRIGHGYAILKHPEVLKSIKQKDIAIEINPISNQVLRLVDDIRNHPATFLIANDYPVVICCDDPTFWGSNGLTYDWYIAFMGMTPRNADLRLLKQLALNSIKYAVMRDDEKLKFYEKWNKSWNNFIDEILEKYLIFSRRNYFLSQIILSNNNLN